MEKVADPQQEPSQLADGLLVREVVHTGKTPMVLSAVGEQAPMVLLAVGEQTPMVLSAVGEQAPMVLLAVGEQAPMAVQQEHAPYRGNHHRAAAAQKHKKQTT